MKTINDLTQWLCENGYPEGADDIQRIVTEEEYAKIHQLLNENADTLSELTHYFITWNKSEINTDYWYEIYERLCIIEENN